MTKKLYLLTICYLFTAKSLFAHSEPRLEMQIVSDLHIEYFQKYEDIPKDLIIPKAPILALVGDIGIAFTDKLKKFIHFQAQQFENVLYIAGNHEFFQDDHKQIKSVQEQLTWLKDMCNEKDNIHFLEQGALEINGVLILGTTLWSNIPDSSLITAECAMSDYFNFYTLDPKDMTTKIKVKPFHTRVWHQYSVRWLKRELENAESNNTPVVVLTHHTPFIQGASDPIYNNSILTSCFSSDLNELLRYKHLQYWASGHTHFNFDTKIFGTHVISNQRGFTVKEKASYQNDGKVIRVY